MKSDGQRSRKGVTVGLFVPESVALGICNVGGKGVEDSVTGNSDDSVGECRSSGLSEKVSINDSTLSRILGSRIGARLSLQM